MPTIAEMIDIVSKKYPDASDMDIVLLKEKYEEIRSNTRSSKSALSEMNEPVIEGSEFKSFGGRGSHGFPFVFLLIVLVVGFLVFAKFKLYPDDPDSGSL